MEKVELTSDFSEAWFEAAYSGKQIISLHLLGKARDDELTTRHFVNILQAMTASSLKYEFLGAVQPDVGFPQMGVAMAPNVEIDTLKGIVAGYTVDKPSLSYSLRIAQNV